MDIIRAKGGDPAVVLVQESAKGKTHVIIPCRSFVDMDNFADNLEDLLARYNLGYLYVEQHQKK